MDILTLKEAVDLYGNETQKQMLIRMKGNLKADSVTSLRTTIKQYYDSVTIEGDGKGRIFICEGKYNEKQPRKTNYSNCGKHKEKQYKEAFTMLLLRYIIQANPNYLHVNHWLTNSGAVDKKLINAHRKHGVRMEHFKELIELNILDDDQFSVLAHYINYEVSYLVSALESAFKRLEEEEIIHHEFGEMACYNRNLFTFSNGEWKETKFKLLDEQTSYEIGLIEEGLQYFYKVTPQLIFLSPNKKEVKDYNVDLKKGLGNLAGIVYTFDAHLAYLEKLTTEECEEILKKEYQSRFRKLYQIESVRNAQSRQDEFNTRGHIIKDYDKVSLLKESKQYVKVWEQLQEYYNIKVGEKESIAITP